ncbi:MAG: hypothetical protein ACYCPQ_01510 [Elusimicrobiota bacterium]
MADNLFPKQPPIPPPLPGGGRQSLPPLPGLPPAPGLMRPPAAAGPADEKQAYEKKMAELEKRLQEEREKVLLASLKEEHESANAAKVESSLRELQDKMRRDRRDQDQEEARLKLEAKIQELERRMAQERETWVATLKNQMQSREFQDKEIETHFAARIQEMERKNLEEKAQWQKALLAKDEDMRTLRSLCEKLKGADGELSKALGEKKWLESKNVELREEAARANAKAQSLAEREKDVAAARADLAVVRREADDLKERLEREISRIRQDYEGETRRVKADAQAETAKYKETAEQSYTALQKFKGVCAAFERQTATLRAQLAKKDGELQSQRVKMEGAARLISHERETLRGFQQQKMALQKAVKSRQESLFRLESLAKELQAKLSLEEKERAALAAKAEGLERLTGAQAAQMKSLEAVVESLKGQIAKDNHVAAFHLKEKEDLARQLDDCRKSKPSLGSAS